MTIDACMRLVDELMPNCISREVKLRLLGEVEGKVRVELLGEELHAVPVLDEDTSMDTELSAPAPYDRLYFSCGLGELDSGLAHQMQCRGQPFSNTVTRIPGPS